MSPCAALVFHEFRKSLKMGPMDKVTFTSGWLLFARLHTETTTARTTALHTPRHRHFDTPSIRSHIMLPDWNLRRPRPSA